MPLFDPTAASESRRMSIRPPPLSRSPSPRTTPRLLGSKGVVGRSSAVAANGTLARPIAVGAKGALRRKVRSNSPSKVPSSSPSKVPSARRRVAFSDLTNTARDTPVLLEKASGGGDPRRAHPEKASKASRTTTAGATPRGACIVIAHHSMYAAYMQHRNNT